MWMADSGAVWCSDRRIVAWKALAQLERGTLTSSVTVCGVHCPTANNVATLVVDCSTTGAIDRAQCAERAKCIDAWLKRITVQIQATRELELRVNTYQGFRSLFLGPYLLDFPLPADWPPVVDLSFRQL